MTLERRSAPDVPSTATAAVAVPHLEGWSASVDVGHVSPGAGFGQGRPWTRVGGYPDSSTCGTPSKAVRSVATGSEDRLVVVGLGSSDRPSLL